jgi:hypothetical protein
MRGWVVVWCEADPNASQSVHTAKGKAAVSGPSQRIASPLNIVGGNISASSSSSCHAVTDVPNSTDDDSLKRPLVLSSRGISYFLCFSYEPSSSPPVTDILIFSSFSPRRSPSPPPLYLPIERDIHGRPLSWEESCPLIYLRRGNSKTVVSFLSGAIRPFPPQITEPFHRFLPIVPLSTPSSLTEDSSSSSSSRTKGHILLRLHFATLVRDSDCSRMWTIDLLSFPSLRLKIL